MQRVHSQPTSAVYPAERQVTTADLPKPTFQAGSSVYEIDASGRVNKFRCGRTLGRGGFAKCYEVTDSAGNVYALKAVNRTTLEKPKTLQKLHSEIAIHRRMKHKHVVNFVRHFKDRYYVYMLLEKCDNGTLMEMLKVRHFSVPEAQYIMLQCLSAMQYMQDQCVIHRDLKPGNIMLDSELNVKIGDFGLAAELQYDGERKRTICGTPNYIAPEIIDRKSHGHSYEVDTWSLGVILYTLLVGQPPFQMEDVESTYNRIRQCRYEFPSFVPENARDLITQILQSSPSHRPTLMDIRTHPFFSSPPPPMSPPSSFSSFGLRMPESSSSSTHSTGRRSLPDTYAASSGKTSAPPREMLRQLNANLPPNQGAPTSPRHYTHVKPPPPPQPASGTQVDYMRALGGTERRPTTMHHPPLSAPPATAAAPNPADDDDEKQQLTALHDRLHQTLCGDIPTTSDAAPADAPVPQVWVTECADFSSKYGMAYRLNTSQTGAHFNDSTKMVWEAITGRVEYYARVRVEMRQPSGESAVFAKDQLESFDVNSFPDALEKKITLIKYFKSYLIRHRSGKDKVEVVRCTQYVPPSSPRLTDPHVSEDFVYVKRWLRTEEAMVFRLSNKTIQVCFNDKAEVILSSEWKVFTYTDPAGVRRTLSLSSVASECEEAATRLRTTKNILYQLIKDHCL